LVQFRGKVFANINPLFANIKYYIQERKARGEISTCFLKKFEKCATSSKPKDILKFEVVR